MQSYKPMLAKSFPMPFSHKDWLFEIKWDGFRAIATINDHFHLKSRNGIELKSNFPEISELKQLAKNVVVDGELIIMRNGVPDFHEMLLRAKATNQKDIERKVKTKPATYVLFDILEKDGKSLVDLPLINRKKILQESVREGNHVCLADSVEKMGEEYYKIVVANGLEGVVAKKKDSTYQPGLRSDSWLKIKQLKTCDCVIFGYTKGEGSRASTLGSLVVGVYDNAEKLVHVCNVSSGLNQEMLDFLTDFFQKTKLEEKGKITSVQPLLVCEVIYQSITRDSCLRAPRFERIRLDKKPTDCTIDQIQNN